MNTLPEVEAAKQLMSEAIRWSVMKWLREKKRVRHMADHANEALDRLSDEIRQRWPENLREAYKALPAYKPGENSNGRVRQSEISSKLQSDWLLARKLKDADDQAYRARMAAEQIFDDAEKKLSTMLAKEGCVKAIQAWEMHEAAISMAKKCVG
jgi:hypothetical protein